MPFLENATVNDASQADAVACVRQLHVLDMRWLRSYVALLS